MREALSAEQIYWAEREDGKRMFRQYVNQGEVNPCVIVDDIIRSGVAISETLALVQEMGAQIIGCGTIVRFTSAPSMIGDVPIRSLVEFETKMYDSAEECADCREGSTAESVRF
ncbi:MAG: phosphoribosyltransferase family protein [Pyrinomonadaceae bacterium]